MQKSSQGRDVHLSKSLSWLLRHGAVKEKIKISDDGYITVNTILNHRSLSKYSLADIIRVVEQNDKKRFSLRTNSTTNELEIKANQGHSIKVENLELRPLECSDSTIVVHGTYLRNWEKIKQNGLSRMNRNHVHFALGIPGDSNVVSGIRRDCDVYIYMNVKKLLEGIKKEEFIYLSKMYCEACKMYLESNQNWREHLSGERHQASLNAMSEGTGIFIRGLEKTVTCQHLKLFFSKFGEIEEVLINKKHTFAIVEFKERRSADLAMSRELILHGRKLRVLPRKRKPNTPDSMYSKTVPTSVVTPAEGNDEIFESSTTCISIDAFEVELNNIVRKIEARGLQSKVNMLCQSLELALTIYFPGCQIHPFGSSQTGLAMKGSDVDIFVDLGDKLTAETAGDIVLKVRNILSKYSEFNKCIAIPSAKVPIVKFFHRSTCLQCDINFQNPFGIHNSNLIKFYISMEPRLRAILMVLKYWAKTHLLLCQGYLTSYALVMLILNYLQQEPSPTLPTVQKLQSLSKSVVHLEDWECHFKCDIKDLDTKIHIDSSLQVLAGFFSFYSLFRFEENVILLKNGIAVHRQLFAKPPEDSQCQTYKLLLEKHNVEPVNLDKVMCVLDPFVLNHNITASTGLKGMNKFQIYCYKAAEICSRIKNQEEEASLQALFTENYRHNSKYPFVMESWEENGDVKLIIPVTSFNPSNSFEHSRKDLFSSGDVEKLKLLIEHLTDVFEKVLKFVFVRTDGFCDDAASSKQIQKTEGMKDVHSNIGDKKLEPFTSFYSSFFQVWNGRNNSYKQFSFPTSMKLMEKEMHVTDYIVEMFYKGSMDSLQKTDLKCSFVPYMKNRCLELQLSLCGGPKSIKPMTIFLVSLLYKWLDK